MKISQPVALVAVTVVALFASCNNASGRLRPVDEAIVAEIRLLLEYTLNNLGDSDEVVGRYGQFQGLYGVKWNRPNYSWQLVERLDVFAVARFENAKVSISLGISKGDNARITRLNMRPDKSYASRGDASTVLIDDEFWIVREGGIRSRSTIVGWAEHPDFVAR